MSYLCPRSRRMCGEQTREWASTQAGAVSRKQTVSTYFRKDDRRFHGGRGLTGLQPNLLLKAGTALRLDQASSGLYLVQSWHCPRMETALSLLATCFNAWLSSWGRSTYIYGDWTAPLSTQTWSLSSCHQAALRRAWLHRIIGSKNSLGWKGHSKVI